MASVIAAAKELVTPSPAEEAKLRKATERIIQKTQRAAREFPGVREVMLGGSFAKGTWLPSEADIDIFIKISTEVDDQTFEAIGLKVGRKAFRGYPSGKKYAQHPYVEATVDGIKFDIVPCFDVEPGSWRSAADRSQFHVRFVREKLDEEAKLQVRLLKGFMKGIGVYGAEIETEGFSGYCAEVLVHNHGNFQGVLRYFAALKPTEEGKLIELRDPIDSDRDLAKAISPESVARMTLASRTFLGAPKLEFFRTARRRVRTPLKKNVFAIAFRHPEISEDTLWGELKKSTKHLVSYIRENGFVVYRAKAASDNRTRSAIIVLPESDEIAGTVARVGPGVEREKETRSFVEANRQEALLIWAGEDGRLHILTERRNSKLESLLRKMVRGEIRKIGASADIAKSVIRTGRLLRGAALEREARREAWLREGIEDVVADTIGTNPA